MQIVSTAAVVEGVLVTANGVCLYGASLDNFNNNLDKMNDAKKLERPDTDSIKDPKEVESEKIGKLKDEVEGIGGKSGSEGVEIDVIKIGDAAVSRYPTGKVEYNIQINFYR